MNANYEKGRRLEYAWKKRLEEGGWLVFRCAGSHGLADLIAFGPSPVAYFLNAKDYPVRLIQCKAGKPTKADREKLKAAKATWGHRWFLATKEGMEEI